MRVVYKFPLMFGQQTILMQAGAKLLHAAAQHGRWMLWAEIDPEAPLAGRMIGFVGTGDRAIEPGWQHITTVLDGDFVWHVYDAGEC
jgi:hypothetical protein